MKYKHTARAITIGLIALSLIAITFVATVAATIYRPYMYVDRKGKYRIFTIDTTTDTEHGVFSGLDVEKSSIVITIYITESDFINVYPDPSSITLTEISITIKLVKQDLPRTALATHVTGNVGTLGDTFYAVGAGWAVWNVH